jgi:hypothetical protein
MPLLALAAACGEPFDDARPYAVEGDEAELHGKYDEAAEPGVHRLGVVEVLVENRAESAALDPSFELGPETASPPPIQNLLSIGVRADFAQFRGIDEDLVRAYAGAPLAPWETLKVGQCISDGRTVNQQPPVDQAKSRSRELTFLDVGRLRFDLRDTGSRSGRAATARAENGDELSLDVGLRLTSTLLSYATGVQYAGHVDLAPLRRIETSEAPISLSWAGTEDGDIAPLRLEGSLPGRLAHTASFSEDFSLELEWSSSSRRRASRRASPKLGSLSLDHDRIILSVTAISGGKASASTTYCRLADRGEATIPAEELWAVGRGQEVHALRVSLARVHTYLGEVRDIGPLRVDLLHRESSEVELGEFAHE